MSEHQYVVRKWVKPEDLNSHGALFGGRLLQWVDEDGAIIAVTQLGTSQLVTRYMSEINFVARADRGDLLELSYRVVRFGRTSITLSCRVVNVITGQEILTLNEIVFVTVDEDGHPKAHGFAEPTAGNERIVPQPEAAGSAAEAAAPGLPDPAASGDERDEEPAQEQRPAE